MERPTSNVEHPAPNGLHGAVDSVTVERRLWERVSRANRAAILTDAFLFAARNGRGIVYSRDERGHMMTIAFPPLAPAPMAAAPDVLRTETTETHP